MNQPAIVQVTAEDPSALKEDTKRILKKHFAFKNRHLDEAKEILDNPETMQPIREKLAELFGQLKTNGKKNGAAIKDIPAYVLATLNNKFGG